jgi:hypothetical protein
MATLNPIPANLWREMRAFIATGQPGQITLHLGTRRRVEKITISYTVAGGEEEARPPAPPARLATQS